MVIFQLALERLVQLKVTSSTVKLIEASLLTVLHNGSDIWKVLYKSGVWSLSSVAGIVHTTGSMQSNPAKSALCT